MTFSGGQTFAVAPNAITVIVGPNNAGKSTFLQNLQAYLQSRRQQSVLTACETEATGTNDELFTWCDERFMRHESGNNPFQFQGAGINVRNDYLTSEWNNGNPGAFRRSAAMFIKIMNGTQQQGEATNNGHYDALTTNPTTAIQRMYADEEFEKNVSGYFRRAFGTNLFVNRFAGNKIPLHCGDPPPLAAGERQFSKSYNEKLRAIDELAQQGDGMKSFAGAMLSAVSSEVPVVCFDEPELFLHPPQAQELGRFMATKSAENRQFFIATHNASFIRGLLDANSDRVSIIRISRQDNLNHAHHLNNEDLGILWNDPILRYSDAINGIFHERVVVCESDSDCHFYAAVANAIAASREIPVPNALFVPTGGKHRLKSLVRALRALAVPVTAIGDIDIFDNEQMLSELVGEFGAQWEPIRQRFLSVKNAFEHISPPLNANQVKQRLTEYLDTIQTPDFQKNHENRVRDIMRSTSPWRMAKRTGIAQLAGQALTDARDLINDLKQIGISILDIGEIERFVPSISDHGPKWASAALERDLIADPELEAARNFITDLLFAGE